MRITPLLTAVLASFSGLVSGGIWAANSADCTAVVVDENGVPLADARITLEDGRGNAYRTETDRAGRFTLHLLAEEYKVEVRKEGFFLLTVQALALHAGQNELTFTLNHAEELHEQVHPRHSRYSGPEYACSAAEFDRLAGNPARQRGASPREWSTGRGDAIPARWI